MKGLYVQTFGCQMNASDSDRMRATLAPLGFENVTEPKSADLILINTCAIRERAEQKMTGFANELKGHKLRNPKVLLGITGCVAQQEKDAILRDFPFVDLVLGPDNIDELPWVLEELENQRTPILRTEFDTGSRVWNTETKLTHPGPTAFVSIMKGCDHFCSYCIVPYTRGREKSRPLADVVRDVRRLVEQGVKEVTFLGQNINTYGKRSEDGDSLDKLFRTVHDIDRLERIRFTTSHPGDLRDELIACYAELPKLCSQFHLPVQSGSDRVLRNMRRFYTRSQYLDRVERLRRARPDIAFTTDIIAGFPGETEEDVALTLSLLEEVRFDNVYSFVFSPRPGTSAAARPDSFTEGQKVERLMRIQEVVRRISLELHEAETGKTHTLLIEGPSKRDPSRVTGRTSQGVAVHLEASLGYRAGDLVKVLITAGSQTHLKAVPLDQSRRASPSATI